MTNPIAETIYHQLGANKFKVMTSARDMLSAERSLSFKLLARTTKNRIAYVKITLNNNDLYDIVTMKCIKKNYCENWVDVDKLEDIPAENLRETFTRLTGLFTSLKG